MPPSSTSKKNKERPVNRTRSPSVIQKVWNYARNTAGSKTPPDAASPSPSRTASLQPASPLLPPTTTPVTAPGSILKTNHPSPTPLPPDALTFDTSVNWLVTHITTLSTSQLVAHLVKLEEILRSPGHARPAFSSIQPVLASTCTPEADSVVRRTAFTFLATYLETPFQDSLDKADDLDCALIWHFIRSFPPLASNGVKLDDEWDQRLRILQTLTSKECTHGCFSSLIPTLCTWQIDILEVISTTGFRAASEASDERISLQRCAAEIQRLLINICRRDVLSMTETDEECVIVAFLKALEIAVRDAQNSQSNVSKDRTELNRE